MHPKPMTRGVFALALVLSVSVSHAQGPPPPPPPPPLQPLGPPPQPPGNPVTTAKANLGKALFWDEQVSSTRTVACGSCHQAASGGSDKRSVPGSLRASHPGPDAVRGTADDVAGSPGVVLNASDGALQWSPLFGMSEQVTGRRAPSHINAAYSPELFWDGRAGRTFVDPVTGETLLPNGGALESQAAGPPVSSGEMGHVGRDWNGVAARISVVMPLTLAVFVPADLTSWIAGRSYAELFAEAFGTAGVTPARILMAIASYERTQFSNQTPFDQAIAGLPALSADEAAGMRLFGQLPCASCHAGSLMSDNAYHYIGVRPATEDSGRAVVTHNPGDVGAMRTPSLRNVALRPSFMHDGRFRTLEEVVAFYDRGGDFNAPNKDPRIRPLNLSPVQRAQLVAFLGRPLTDARVAASLAPFDRPTLFSEGGLVPEVLAGGVPGSGGTPPQPVALEPPLTGNPEFTVGVYGAPAGAEAVLVIDAAEPPASGGAPFAPSFARIATTLSGSGATGGYGSATLAIPDDPALYGTTLYGRWYVTDAGAAGGVASSPAFRMTVFGPHGAGLGTLASGGVGGPRTMRLYASEPNPFRPRTSIRYDLFTASSVRLAVYDVAGRRVRRLVDAVSQVPGAYSVTWDGRDDRGRAVPGGVYFYRLETDRQTQTSRVARLE